MFGSFWYADLKNKKKYYFDVFRYEKHFEKNHNYTPK